MPNTKQTTLRASAVSPVVYVLVATPVATVITTPKQTHPCSTRSHFRALSAAC